jgi:selT/selW/selH-like putative selenoprotein
VEAELKSHYPDSTITLIEGSGGIFDVKCDGALIYSKQKSPGNRFPDEGEITGLISRKTKYP